MLDIQEHGYLQIWPFDVGTLVKYDSSPHMSLLETQWMNCPLFPSVCFVKALGLDSAGSPDLLTTLCI